MKLKAVSLVVLVLGVVYCIIGALLPIVYINSLGTVGIIGGTVESASDLYSDLFLKAYNGLPFYLCLIGTALIGGAAFCLIFAKTVRANCTVKTSLTAFALSAVGALGIFCFFLWTTIVAFGEVSRSPISYPVSILLGFASFLGFFLLIALYIKFRKESPSIKGFIIDVLTSVIYLPLFFFIYSFLYNLLDC